MKVTGEYMGKRDEMILEVLEKEQNRRLVTKQTEGPFQKWESTRVSKQWRQFNQSQSNYRLRIAYYWEDC